MNDDEQEQEQEREREGEVQEEETPLFTKALTSPELHAHATEAGAITERREFPAKHRWKGFQVGDSTIAT
jgi:hypothetical protein